MIEEVRQWPPLRVVDAWWGCHKDVRSKKGHLLAWRPRNDEDVHVDVHAGDGPDSLPSPQAWRKWSQYLFFTKRIEESVANGRMAQQAIHKLDGLRGPQTVPQLHRELQPKGRRKKQSPPTKTNSTAAVGGTDDDRSTEASFPPGDDEAMED